ncbi:hypothetical protein ANCCAN_10984 [Ancylostoma caninum]|uniref:Uncharacterized protein n=1 Tax=Ancylostoma caninum TaxID=29170 RepID=A0A368GF53_ANCCA|nr:hypothetical protein ANCCAN_10984 [Ancylostoma caninum]
MDLKFPLGIKVFFVLLMVDVRVSGRREPPPACKNGTIPQYSRELISFFFNLINNLTLPYDCDLERRARAEFMLPDTNDTRLNQRLSYQQSEVSFNTLLWKAFTSWEERIKEMSGLVEFGCYFLHEPKIISRILCVILNQQFNSPRE